jgi:hypothetical protein
MVYLRVSENSEQAKVFLEFVRTMPFVELIGEQVVPNDLTLKSFNDYKKGKVKNAENVTELLEKLDS